MKAMMDSATIRQKFLDFFKGKGHQIVPSAPLVLKNDPTLLFTNSGMVQFKDYFLGNGSSPYKRIADTQKCLRVSGKHNDLEDVGLDTYHHTMFEMLGNWSFGDYFKEEAIGWAWELLTGVYQLPKERLYVTVFGGDAGDRLPMDEEAKGIWKKYVSEERILLGKKKDNFWEMGEQGPCGPCSEVHIDLRSEAEIARKPGKELVNNDHPQVVEIWNLVFIQFNRLASGALEPLPDKHVDTGMGFERLCMAIQGKTSNYDTDVFAPLIEDICFSCRVRYGQDPKKDVAIRVIADHIRAVAFAIADGQLPSNTGAGYVIRRILRRSIRYGYSYLNLKSPHHGELVDRLAEQMGQAFPGIVSQRDFIKNVILEEEKSFLITLEKGLARIGQFLGAPSDLMIAKSSEFGEINATREGKILSGAVAFELYDTYGFPFDLTSLIARERGFSVDEEGFKREMAKQKERSKADAAKETGDWISIRESDKIAFIGYEHVEAAAHLVKYRQVKQKNKELVQLVFDHTPFYAESGGQVGDTGWIACGEEKIAILDTKKENELIVHYAETLPRQAEGVWHLHVDRSRRMATMNNHSATHLLHAALREVLGKHVEQKGSLVNEKILRFDFSHFAAMTDEELVRVEDRVNQKIREDIFLHEERNVPLEKAKQLGAMALFGEKYGEFVRVITFDPRYSVELCGGTHVPSTGHIGFFKIVSESSVAAGVRRIEAVTAAGAETWVREQLDQLAEVKQIFKNPKDILAASRSLLEEKHTLEKKLEQIYLQQAAQLKDQLALKAVKKEGLTVIIERVDVPSADVLKNIAYALRNQFADLLLILAAAVDGKPQVAVMLGEELAKKKVYHAGQLVKELAREIDGGGGGQDFFATAGGKKSEGLAAVLTKAHELIAVKA
jgi:alanyl-tRNA synthetase